MLDEGDVLSGTQFLGVGKNTRMSFLSVLEKLSSQKMYIAKTFFPLKNGALESKDTSLENPIQDIGFVYI